MAKQSEIQIWNDAVHACAKIVRAEVERLEREARDGMPHPLRSLVREVEAQRLSGDERYVISGLETADFPKVPETSAPPEDACPDRQWRTKYDTTGKVSEGATGGSYMVGVPAGVECLPTGEGDYFAQGWRKWGVRALAPGTIGDFDAQQRGIRVQGVHVEEIE